MRSVLTFAAVVAAVAVPSAQEPRLDDLLGRVAVYISHFVGEFSNVVADEYYQHTNRAPATRYRSEFLLVRYPGSSDKWQTFRDVSIVNDFAVSNQQERLARLFLEPFDDAIKQAEAITRYSGRYIPTLCDPLIGMAFLQRQYRTRFTFTLGDKDRIAGAEVRRIRFREEGSDTILHTDRGLDLPSRGEAWIEERTGRVVRTNVQIGVPNATTVITTFTRNPSLQIDVPLRMEAEYASVKAEAKYSRFRRFEVRTQETITPITRTP